MSRRVKTGSLRRSLLAVVAAFLAPACGGSLTLPPNDAGGSGQGGATIMTGGGGAMGTGGSGGSNVVVDASCLPACGRVMDMVSATDGSCTYQLPCPLSAGADFTGLAVLVNGQSVPMDPTDGWSYTDGTLSAFQLHGQACLDATNAEAGVASVAVSYLCELP